MKSSLGGVAIVLLLTHGPALRADCEGNPAIAYLEVIEAMDRPAMQRFLAPNARYLDPTMIYFDRAAIDLRGPEAIVDFWRSASEGSATQKLEFSYRACSETAGYSMILYDVVGTTAGEVWNVNRDQISISGAVTSIIRIVDGAVVEHRDYVDYQSAIDEVERQRDQFGPALKEMTDR